MTTDTQKPADQSVGAAAQRLAAIIGGPSVVAAAMYYFGWSRTSGAAEAAGLEQSVLGFSTTDYVLRGSGPVIAMLFKAVLITAVMGVSLWTLRHSSHRRVRAAERWLGAHRGVIVGGGVVLAAAAVALWQRTVGSDGGAAWVDVSAALLLGGAGLIWTATTIRRSDADVARVATVVLLAALIAGGFEMVRVRAASDGMASIAQVRAEIARGDRMFVRIVTTEDARINLAGYDRPWLLASSNGSDQPGDDDTSLFVYENVHLLVDTGDRLAVVSPCFGTGGIRQVAIVPSDIVHSISFSEVPTGSGSEEPRCAAADEPSDLEATATPDGVEDDAAGPAPATPEVEPTDGVGGETPHATTPRVPGHAAPESPEHPVGPERPSPTETEPIAAPGGPTAPAEPAGGSDAAPTSPTDPHDDLARNGITDPDPDLGPAAPETGSPPGVDIPSPDVGVPEPRFCWVNTTPVTNQLEISWSFAGVSSVVRSGASGGPGLVGVSPFENSAGTYRLLDTPPAGPQTYLLVDGEKTVARCSGALKSSPDGLAEPGDHVDCDSGAALEDPDIHGRGSSLLPGGGDSVCGTTFEPVLTDDDFELELPGGGLTTLPEFDPLAPPELPVIEEPDLLDLPGGDFPTTPYDIRLGP